MKPTKLFLALAVAVLLGACSQQHQPTSYTVKGILRDSAANGKYIHIYNYDTRECLDTAIIEGNVFSFTGVSDSAIHCRIIVPDHHTDGYFGTFILENGNITLDLANSPHKPSGTLHNDMLCRVEELKDCIQKTRNSKELFKLYGRKLFAEHANDVIGYALLSSPFLSQAGTNKERCELLYSLGPAIKATQQYAFRAKMYQPNANIGLPFKDIRGVDEKGNPVALSYYAGKGKYVLIDMWASWCAPCKKEIPYLAQVYEKYKNKGLAVIGVFTWDKSENLSQALEQQPLITWPQIVDVENTAMKLYDVEGVPTLVLIAPDGTVIELDNEFRGENMIKTVGEYLEAEQQ